MRVHGEIEMGVEEHIESQGSGSQGLRARNQASEHDMAASATTEKSVSITVHVAASGRRQAEVLLHEPEAAVVDVRGDDRAGAERNHEQFAFVPGTAAATGAIDAGGRGDRDGR